MPTVSRTASQAQQRPPVAAPHGCDAHSTMRTLTERPAQDSHHITEDNIAVHHSNGASQEPTQESNFYDTHLATPHTGAKQWPSTPRPEQRATTDNLLTTRAMREIRQQRDGKRANTTEQTTALTTLCRHNTAATKHSTTPTAQQDNMSQQHCKRREGQSEDSQAQKEPGPQRFHT